MKQDVYSRITNKIVTDLEAGVRPWHQPWNDIINIQLQKCLKGETTADQACDAMIDGIAKAKRAV